MRTLLQQQGRKREKRFLLTLKNPDFSFAVIGDSLTYPTRKHFP